MILKVNENALNVIKYALNDRIDFLEEELKKSYSSCSLKYINNELSKCKSIRNLICNNHSKLEI